MLSSSALIFAQFGIPADVLKLVSQEVADPGPREVLLRCLASPIHPSDIGIVLGKYGQLPQLPAVGGREGVAEVVACGEGVTDITVGQRVSVPRGVGAWQTYAVADAEDLFHIPSDIPLEMAAMATVNPPTAWRLLRDGNLSKGDWVIQNAANSAVGLHVIEMARHLGLKTLNVVRREELLEPLKGLGADAVVLEESGYEKDVASITGGEPVLLALNSIGGESAVRLVRALSDGGQHVTFGAMQFEKVRFPTRELIFHDISLRGFWMDQWMRQNSRPRIQVMFDKIFDLMRKGEIRPSVEATYSLAEWSEAFASASRPRLGKILFRMDS
jgi:trans-2-enoyl-CoA reductase